MIIKTNWPKGFLLRYFRLCYRVITFLSTLVSNSFVFLACCCFDFFYLVAVVFCIASGAQLSFASLVINSNSVNHQEHLA